MKTRRISPALALLPMLLASLLLSAVPAVAAGKSAPATKKAGASATKKAGAKGATKAKKKEAEEAPSSAKMPWALRDHFTITVGKTTMLYGVDNTEWNLEVEGIGTSINDARAKVAFADGTSWDTPQAEHGDADRKAFTNQFGDGMEYTVTLPAKNGLLLRHSVASHKQRPFFVIQVELENKSSTPVEIASISPVVFAGNGIRFFDSPDSGAHMRHLVGRGPYPVYDPTAPVSLTVLNNRGRDFTLAIGTLPTGIPQSSVNLAKKGDAYYGEVTCTFDPPVTLAPGAKLSADPVWLSFAEPKPTTVDLFYSWAQSVLPKPAPCKDDEYPQSWVTVGADGSLDDLAKSLRQWSAAGVNNALIPASWQAGAGSIEGAGSKYPRNMASAVRELKKAASRSTDDSPAPSANTAKKSQPKTPSNTPKWLAALGIGNSESSQPAQTTQAAPAEDSATAENEAEASKTFSATATPTLIGITVDPLKIEGGKDEWAAVGTDKVRYVNPMIAEGRAYAVERMRQLAKAGFGFYVIPASTIPKDVLKKFAMTRAQADTLSFAILSEATGGKPVLPASTATLKGDMSTLLEASASSSRLREFGVITGPVRMDATNIERFSEEQLAAMMFYGGPIEFVGAPSAGVRETASLAFPRPRIWARALDIASPAPRLWLVQPKGSDEDAYGSAVVMFPGSGAWDTAWYEYADGKPVRLWRAENGNGVEVKGKVPATDKLAVFGVSQDLPRPILLSVTPGQGFSLHAIDSAKWDEAAGVLSGSLRGNGADSSAYIVVPSQWKLDSGKVGDTALRGKDGATLIALAIDKGKQTAFSAKFVRR